MGEVAVAGRARGGVERDTAGGRVMIGESCTRVRRLVVGIEEDSEGGGCGFTECFSFRLAGERDALEAGAAVAWPRECSRLVAAAELAEDPAQQIPVDLKVRVVLQAPLHVVGDLRPGAEDAMGGDVVGEQQVIGIRAVPHRVVGGDGSSGCPAGSGA